MGAQPSSRQLHINCTNKQTSNINNNNINNKIHLHKKRNWKKEKKRKTTTTKKKTKQKKNKHHHHHTNTTPTTETWNVDYRCNQTWRQHVMWVFLRSWCYVRDRDELSACGHRNRGHRNQSDGLSHPVRDVNFITHQVLRDGDELGTNQMVTVTLWQTHGVVFIIDNDNVHLSCAHQRPERSHDTY